MNHTSKSAFGKHNLSMEQKKKVELRVQQKLAALKGIQFDNLDETKEENIKKHETIHE